MQSRHEDAKRARPKVNDHPHEFVCLDCNAHVVTWGGNRERDRCYNCTFVRRVCDTPEERAEMRKILGCELYERENDGNENSSV